MSDLRMEEWNAGVARTPEEARTALRNLIDRKGVMSVPVQREDDDIVLHDVLREWEELRDRVVGLTAAVELANRTSEQRCRDHGCGRG